MRSVARVVVAIVVALVVAAPTTSGVAQERVERLRISFPTDEGSLTPYTFEFGYSLMSLVYDTVMVRDEEGYPRPWLARSVEMSPDARMVTITLRDDLEFHDGERLTSADVAFTFRYVAANYHPRFTPQVADMAEVLTPDDRTVMILLDKPQAGFLDQPLADMPVLPEHIWSALPPGRAAPRGPAVGSGPYRLADRDPGTGYRLEAVPDYFKGRPTVDTLEVEIIAKSRDTAAALERREIDAIPTRIVESVGGIGIAREQGPSYAGTALLFNLRNPPFDSRAARRAVAAAIDLERLARGVGGVFPARHGYIHPSSGWAPHDLLQEFDQERARRVFRRLDLGPIRILAPDNDPAREEAARQVALALVRAGADAEEIAVSPERLGRAIGEDGARPTFSLAVGGIPSLVSHDPAFLTAVFGTGRRNAPINYTGYRSREFDRAAAETAATTDPSARLNAVQNELEVIARDAPAIPLMFPEHVVAYRHAIYDDWVFVKGEGILDKQSFLPGLAAQASERAGASRGIAPPPPSDDGFPALEAAAAVLFAAGAVLFVAGFRRSRR